MTKLDFIITLVTRHYGITKNDLISKQRPTKVCLPRHVVMYLAANYTPLSLPTIGRKLGNRDHTTVLHGKNKIEKLIFEDDDLRTQMQAFVAVILEMAGLCEEPIIEEPVQQMVVYATPRHISPPMPRHLPPLTVVVEAHKSFDALLAASKAVTQQWCALSSYASPIARANTLPRFQAAMNELQNLIHQQKDNRHVTH
jgi:hypothetical protein